MIKQKLVEAIVDLEWDMMAAIDVIEDPLGCTKNPGTFRIMRSSQHMIWSKDTLESYYCDLLKAKAGRTNMSAERYARMMEVTDPEGYKALEKDLRPVAPEARKLADEIAEIFARWTADLDRKYKNIRAKGRPATENGIWTSVDTYLRGELLTYSSGTLALCLRDARRAADEGRNLAEQILLNMAHCYGVDTLEELERLEAED
jgi:hypothetical protein